MNKMRAFVMLGIAMIAGLAAVVVASQWLLGRSNAGIQKVAVAAVDVNLGQRIGQEAIKLVDWPSGSVPAGAFSDVAKLDGRVLKTSLLRGEPVLEAKLAPEGTQGGLSAVIKEGRRAITVRVNDVIGVAGFALPGNYVDIIVNTQRDGDHVKDKSISKIVLERILVLAVAQEVGRDDTKPRVVNAVTLEVTPEQAERLDLARSVGTLSLALRNQVDQNTDTTEGMTKLTLLDLRKEPEPKPAAPKPVTHRVAKAPRPVQVAMDCVGVITGVRGSQECF